MTDVGTPLHSRTLPSRVYFIVDPLDTGRDPVALARAMLAGGARLLQLRLKRIGTGTLLATAEAVRELTAAAGACLIVNDRVDVALAAGADGVHLGQDDLPVAVARALIGPSRWIGVSTHSEEQLATAAGCGADYLSLGPIFATTSKVDVDPVIGCVRLRNARPRVREPLVAIGGITAATIRDVLDAGADAVSVIAAVIRAPDVERAAAELLEIAAAPGTPAGP
jgi:thiamine-phosphate diphosphorylase